MFAQRTRTHRLGRSGKRGTEVFEQERNPSKGTCLPGAQPPGGIQCRRLLARQVEEVGNDGVQMAPADAGRQRIRTTPRTISQSGSR